MNPSTRPLATTPPVPGTDHHELYAFAITMAACLVLALSGRSGPAALTDYAATLTGLYAAWHNRPRR
ncbi:hypothetical protein [Streptomyces sp. NPDC053048]|uniref:hypothetical protein n=1 Tax=Streptomyces sp. NPDC053048 TaxID=3365694 RepID=UPI0037D69C76